MISVHLFYARLSKVYLLLCKTEKVEIQYQKYIKGKANRFVPGYAFFSHD